MSQPTLYITHRVPYPPDKGDRIRNYHLLRQLCQRGPVWLAALADEPIPSETRTELARLCDNVACVPVSNTWRWMRAASSLAVGRSLSEGLFSEPGLRRVLQNWTRKVRFRAAVVSASSLAPYLRGNGLEQVPAYVDLVDVDSQKWYDFAEASRGLKRWIYRLEGDRVRRLEQEICQWAEVVSLVSPHEAAVLASYTAPGTALVAQNGVDHDYFTPLEAREKLACAFVGALDYLPNIDAACWFARVIWPQIRQRHPTAEFWIIGRKPAREVLALSQLPGVVVVGQVPDVRPHVAQAAVVVVPMRLSRGLQNKVLEALAMGKAVVAGAPALAALQTIPDEHLLQADTPEDWAAKVSELLSNPARRQRLGYAGLVYVQTHHNWDRCLKPLLDRIAPETLAHAATC